MYACMHVACMYDVCTQACMYAVNKELAYSRGCGGEDNGKAGLTARHGAGLIRTRAQ